MRHGLVHQIVGYDASQRLAFECDIPAAKMETVLKIVRVEEDDPEAIEAYALDIEQVRAITGMLDRSAPADLSYFLECFTSTPTNLTRRSSARNAGWPAVPKLERS